MSNTTDEQTKQTIKSSTNKLKSNSTACLHLKESTNTLIWLFYLLILIISPLFYDPRDLAAVDSIG